MLFVSSVLVENISLIFISVYRATPALTRGLGFCGLIPRRAKHSIALINTMIITHWITFINLPESILKMIN